MWNETVFPIWARYARLRTRLYPYIAAASDEYQHSGLPISRQLSLAYPDDSAAVGDQLDFMFGPDLLAAPVVTEGATQRTLHLPAGRWVDFWNAVGYTPDGRFALGHTQLIDGGGDVTVDAPLEELPLFVRAGAVLPLLPKSIDTLADEGAGLPGLNRLADAPGHVRVLYAFPRGRTRAAMDAGGRIRSAELTRGGGPGVWRLRVRHPDAMLYRLRASLATLHRPFEPCAVIAGGERLPAGKWRYDAEAQTLRTRFRPEDGTARLRVVGSGPACRPARRA